MKIYFNKISEDLPSGVSWEENRVCFSAARPIIVQPSETMKVSTNTIIKVEKGCTLNIGSHPQLVQKAASVFPSLITLDHTSEEAPLEIAIHNSGRNPLNIMPGTPLGVGYVYLTEDIEPEEFSITVIEPKTAKSKPTKKNPDVQFEIK